MKVAIAQLNPIVGDVAGNTAKIKKYIKDAREKDVELMVLPELALIGYPPMDLLNNKLLVSDNLSALEELASVAPEIGIVCGYVDRDENNSAILYNSAAFIYQGKIIAKQNKSLLPTYDVFDEARYFCPAANHQLIDFKGYAVGITICEDIWNSEFYSDREFIEERYYTIDPVSIVSKLGANLILNLSASPYVMGKTAFKAEMLKSIAQGTKTTLLYANQVGANDSLIFDGNSFIFNKDGICLAQGASFEEELIITDLSEKNDHLKINDPIADLKSALTLGIKDYMNKCGFKTAIIGLSGGIDSALTAALAVEAIGAENVRGFTMPSQYSSTGSIDDSVELASNLGIKIDTIPIGDIFNTFNKELYPIFSGMKEDVTEENLQARIRGNILMSISNKFKSLLLTTGNKSELSMGYCTMYGDMAGGLAVISDLPKMLVYELSRYFNKDKIIIPENILTKAPSAELRPNQKDEDSLPPYPVLDAILELYIEQDKNLTDIVSAGYNKKTVKWIIETVDRNEYKRRQAAPGLKVTGKAYGLGRRMPMAQKHRI